MKHALGAGWWASFVARVRARGGNAAHHVRRAMRNRPGGWGHYSLSIMGPHRIFWYSQLCNAIHGAGLGVEAVILSYLFAWLCACFAGLLAC